MRGTRRAGLDPVRVLAAIVLCLMAVATWAASQIDVYDFPDQTLEQRYRGLIDEFRCPKCLNTNLAGSDAPIAKDLRQTVYRLVVLEGRSDQEVRDYLQARYGDFVLYDPPFRPGTWLLWLGPVLFIAVGLWVLLRIVRARPEPLPDESDRERARALLSAGDD